MGDISFPQNTPLMLTCAPETPKLLPRMVRELLVFLLHLKVEDDKSSQPDTDEIIAREYDRRYTIRDE